MMIYEGEIFGKQMPWGQMTGRSGTVICEIHNGQNAFYATAF